MTRSRKREKFKIHLLLNGKPATEQEIIDALNRKSLEKELGKLKNSNMEV
ncbi:hypothetical protein [Pseudobacteroides cellulosolvens]|uniref:Uncharacterized protein n=1 Tax=Pseudobacteroides cellulosolvens ATCC 35603 = DSM 2933 TaxID=398512 RepID=A0A0L6JXA8_9FIRM|nr:hypothetical protein [Pseudobacteroides cellulosolvens]KNY30205.1 hypothetical protein Bccel_5482 [Pseudobacteroides cellulosolvens ATCC 35603 = DSM 2933]